MDGVSDGDGASDGDGENYGIGAGDEDGESDAAAAVHASDVNGVIGEDGGGGVSERGFRFAMMVSASTLRKGGC